MSFLWLFLFYTSFMSTPTESSSIQVTIHSLRNTKGVILLSVYNSSDGFPSNADKAVKLVKTQVTGEKTEIRLENLPAGTYAISVMHDENNNGEMDTGLFGIPKEGYGASNDAKATFGPPSFNDAKFTHQKVTVLQIKMRYF